MTEFKKGIYCGPQGRAWTEPEIAFIKKVYCTHGWQAVQKYVPDRSRYSIVGKAKGLGLAARRFQLGDIKEITAIDAGRIAAYIDGEGSIRCMLRERFCPYIMVCNTCRPMVKWVHETVGFGVVDSSQSKKFAHHKRVYKWRLSRARACYQLARIILPYLIVKRQNACQLIAYCEKEFHFSAD